LDEGMTKYFTKGSLKSIEFTHDSSGNVDPSKPAYLTGVEQGQSKLYIKATTNGNAFAMGYVSISSNDCSDSSITSKYSKGYDLKITKGSGKHYIRKDKFETFFNHQKSFLQGSCTIDGYSIEENSKSVKDVIKSGWVKVDF
jgi:hypothetical protein